MKDGRVCGIVLNGGGSTRMGRDKSQLIVGGKCSVDRVSAVLSEVTSIVVINQNEDHPDYQTIPDMHNDVGPLAGLYAVMKAKKEPWYLLSACDTPFVTVEVYSHISTYMEEGTDAIIPVYEDRIHPLSGAYHRRILPKLEKYLEDGGRSVRGLFREISTKKVDYYPDIDEDLLSQHFFNMNRPKDYEKAKEMSKIKGN